MKKLLFIIPFIISCGHNNDKATTSPTASLQTKYETYLNLTPNELDQYGFVSGWNSGDKCDSLLWTSLYDSAGGKTDIAQAQIQAGEWTRHPGGDCTSISRDMIIGLLTYIWHTRNLQMIEDLIDYGESHGFQMNSTKESDGAEIMSPDIIATMYLMQHKLNGPASVAEAFAQSWWISGQTGFEAHLQVLHLLLRGLMNGAVSDTELKLLKAHATDNPDNAFYNAVYHKFYDGNQVNSINALMNETWFPSNSLPTSSNYCTDPYLYQRDEDTADWKPCPEQGATHSGVDMEFAAAVVLGIIQ